MRRKKKIITVFTVVFIVVLKFFQRSIVYDGIFFTTLINVSLKC